MKNLNDDIENKGNFFLTKNYNNTLTQKVLDYQKSLLIGK